MGRLFFRMSLAAALSSASAVAMAQVAPEQSTSTGSAGGIDDIVVTARRTSESLQKVPLAVTAIEPTTLQNNNITTFQDLARVVPSLSTYSPYTLDVTTIIRGQGSFIQGGVPAVTTYLNDVPLPGFAGGPGLFYDLQNVQVLKGAQGTLFGRNSTGGAVLFQTQKPTEDFGGYVQVGFGNYSNREVTAAINIPIVPEKILLRVAGNFQDQDGYAHAASTPLHPNGIDLNNRDLKTVRATLVIRPADNFKTEFFADYYSFKNNGDNTVLTAVNSAFFDQAVAPSFGQAAADALRQQFQTRLAQQQALGIRNLVPRSLDTPNFKNSLTLINTTTWDVSDNLTFKNIFAYVKVKNRKPYDGDGFDIPQLDFGPSVTDDVSSQYTEELQLQGKSSDGRLNFTLGLFYLNSPKGPFYVIDRKLFFGFAVAQDQSRSWETSKAVFGQATYEPLDGLHLTAGLRYTKDDRSGETRGLTGNGAAAFCATPVPGASPSAPCLTGKSAKSSKLTGNISADYQITPETLVYGAIRRGYRAGGPNIQTILPENASFAPEQVTDYEIGLKSDFKVGMMPVRANIAAYHTDIKGQQISFVEAEAVRPALLLTIVRNRGNSTVNGVEAEFTLKPLPHLIVGLSGSYTDQKLDLPLGTVRQGLSKYQFAASGSYDHRLPGDAGVLSLSASYTGRSSFNGSDQLADPVRVQPTFGLFNASLSWNDVMGSKVDLTVYGSNLFNKDYRVGEYGLYTSLGYSAITYGEPRMYGVRARYSF